MRPYVNPLPAIAAGKGPFRVTIVPSDSSASCAPPCGDAPGYFNVPLETDSIQALAMRMHELGHLGLCRLGAIPGDVLSRLQKSRIHPGWAQFALDVVVNSFMISRGNPEIAQLEVWRGVLPLEIPRWLAAMEFLRSEGLGREMHMRMSLQARAQFNRDELKLLCSMARILQERGAKAEPLPTMELRKLLKKLQKTFGPDSEDTTHPLPELVTTMKQSGYGERGLPESDQSEWGPMTMQEPPLIHHSDIRRRAARKLIPSYCGAFRLPHRALLPAADGRAFGLRKRFRGGTILIDCSGSMNLTNDELKSLVSQTTAVTVALYAGLPGNEDGVLLIVARNGRFAAIEEAASSLGNGNVIDGHALRWLSHQPKPRIWVSDGFVTGRGDTSGAKLNEETESILQVARIKRIESLERC